MSRFKHHNRFAKIEGSGYCYVQPDTKLCGFGQLLSSLIFKCIRQLTMFINGIFSTENLNMQIENFEKVRLNMMSLFFYTYRLEQLLYAVR